MTRNAGVQPVAPVTSVRAAPRPRLPPAPPPVTPVTPAAAPEIRFFFKLYFMQSTDEMEKKLITVNTQTESETTLRMNFSLYHAVFSVK